MFPAWVILIWYISLTLCYGLPNGTRRLIRVYKWVVRVCFSGRFQWDRPPFANQRLDYDLMIRMFAVILRDLERKIGTETVIQDILTPPDIPESRQFDKTEKERCSLSMLKLVGVRWSHTNSTL